MNCCTRCNSHSPQQHYFTHFQTSDEDDCIITFENKKQPSPQRKKGDEKANRVLLTCPSKKKELHHSLSQLLYNIICASTSLTTGMRAQYYMRWLSFILK